MERQNRPENSLFAGLTEPQKAAVSHVDGPLLVLAGPGSGKTTVVTRRVANLIANGIPPWQVLALTFTNKAAGEMRERILKLVPDDIPGRRGLTIATFHSFSAQLLRRYAAAAGLSPRFTIYDSGDQRDAIKLALKEADMDTKNWTPASVHHAISGAKNNLMDAAAYASHASDFYTRSIAKAFAAYERILKKNDALDFDDLLLVTAKLLRHNEQVRRELQQRFQYIMIDEYQDTNHAQFVIAHSLAAAHGNICVVGDPDQSIYGWRGADIRNILEFEKHYPNATIVPLGQNFRSTSHIVETAAKLIQHNRKRKHKRLHTELGEGEKPVVVTCFDEHHEAALIVDEFRKRHDAGDIPWREMAVLYRINALSRVLEESFRNANIPYVIARGTAFYERKEVKDALAYLRVVANPNDEVSLRRIINTPTRGIGNTTVDKIEIYAIDNQLSLFDALRRAGTISDLAPRAASAIAKFVAMVNGWREAANGPSEAMIGGSDGGLLGGEKNALAALVERIVHESGLEAMYRKSKAEEDIERWENLNELINAAAEFEPAPRDDDQPPEALSDKTTSVLDVLHSYLESVALVSDADAIDPANGAVTLMTLHAAKGLEFDAVAIAGLEEGLLPHSRSTASDDELEEERRLLFVGITRARKHLMISHAAMRTNRGMRERTMPSQFLRELPEDSVILNNQAPQGIDNEQDDFGDIEWGRSSFDAAGRTRQPRPGSDARRSAADGGPRSYASGAGASGKRSVEIEFPIGCTVQHPKFGIGRVEAVTPRVSGSSVQVAFASVGRKTLILEFAKLQRVDR